MNGRYATKFWNQDLSHDDTVLDRVDVDTEDEARKNPCCIKLKTQRLSQYLRLHKELYPENLEENQWEHQNDKITL